MNTQRSITIGYGPGYSKSDVWKDITSKLIIPTEIVSSTTAKRYSPGLILLDHHLLAELPLDKWREEFPDTIMLATESMNIDVDLILSNNLPYKQTCKLIEMACYQWVLKSERNERARSQDSSNRYLKKLADIGISLSAEGDLMTLLRKILSEGQNIACCDAASLFLINEVTEGRRELVFKLTQNDSMEFPFEEKPFPLDENSIAGYVALTGSELNVPDAYQVPKNEPYRFNESYDRNTGYRTKSVFAIPLKDKQKEVIGVLEFINRKKARSLKVTDEKSAQAYTQPFEEDINILLQALASQAGIAIENTILYNDIKSLFEGFVNASVSAIEQRDPTTSGHSFRVADLCVGLASSVSIANSTRLQNISFTDTEVQELRYAALLHDFGKVGVRESVLVKEKKLRAGSLDNINYRILLAQEKLRTKALGRQLNLYEKGSVSDGEIQDINGQLEADLALLQEFYESIKELNEPSILKQDNRDMLDRISAYRMETGGDEFTIITQEEFELLTIPKGSLSPSERKEIESHVVHTQNFLNHIPWTKELGNIPTIAGAHHEKLDGSGYPHGMTAAEIPTQSKIMTICDIYDALTASDRPYKPAMNTERAIDILVDESERGMLDGDLVQVFVEASVFKAIDPKHVVPAGEGDAYSTHPCDYDLHKH